MDRPAHPAANGRYISERAREDARAMFQQVERTRQLILEARVKLATLKPWDPFRD